MESFKTYYWPLQISGWTLLLIILCISSPILSQSFDWNTFLHFTLSLSFGFLFSHLYRNYLKVRNWAKLKTSDLLLIFIALPYLLAIVWSLFIVFSGIYFFEKGGNLTYYEWFQLTIQLYLVYFGWTLIYSFYKIFTIYRQSEIDKWKLEANVKDAQIIALKSQINPHFIFNSLNNIRSLITENPEKSRDMITYLSGLLRYSIQFNNMEKVTVKEELNIVRSYLYLESIQLEDRLNFNIEVDESASEIKIPPMSIQVLVENAIKHGISKLPNGGNIAVKVFIKNDKLNVQVINSGQLEETDSGKSTGIGLKNTTERIKLLYGESADFSIKNISENEVGARFVLPLKKEMV